jgi:hypothetical protein
MLAKGLLLLVIGMIASAAHASERQIWECRTANPNAQAILHLVEWGDRSYIRFTHVRFTARYETEGERHGWYWHNEGSGYYRYAILLGPGGQAWLHDFDVRDEDGLSPALDTFHCRRIA